jgi:hypothetical protein
MLRYGSENWTLSRSESRNTETVVTTILLPVTGYALTWCVRNMTVDNALQKKEYVFVYE